jgi:hypothetical protein
VGGNPPPASAVGIEKLDVDAGGELNGRKSAEAADVSRRVVIESFLRRNDLVESGLEHVFVLAALISAPVTTEREDRDDHEQSDRTTEQVTLRRHA